MGSRKSIFSSSKPHLKGSPKPLLGSPKHKLVFGFWLPLRLPKMDLGLSNNGFGTVYGTVPNTGFYLTIR